MLLRVQTHLKYRTTAPCAVLLQVEAAQDECQKIETLHQFDLPNIGQFHTIAGQDDIGLRRWFTSDTTFLCDYDATVEITRSQRPLLHFDAVPLVELDAQTTSYLMASRYCEIDPFLTVTAQQFGTLSGGAKIAAMADWIRSNFTYDIFASSTVTSAAQSYAQKAGVCRDYAHVLISMARAAAIPARYVSCYAPDVSPQDFHAVTEVYLDHAWHLVDATGMANPAEIIRIGVGQDATDVSFMTSYGWMELEHQSVRVTRQ